MNFGLESELPPELQELHDYLLSDRMPEESMEIVGLDGFLTPLAIAN